MIYKTIGCVQYPDKKVQPRGSTGFDDAAGASETGMEWSRAAVRTKHISPGKVSSSRFRSSLPHQNPQANPSPDRNFLAVVCHVLPHRSVQDQDERY
jgi:hypothetical protein